MSRSVIEEASSVAKAIEKAWHNAGKPEEFTVKVFQQSERNIIGFTTKSAKVGLFFSARHVPQSASDRTESRHRSPQRSRQRDQRVAPQPSRHRQEPRPEAAPRAEMPQNRGSVWTDELTSAAAEWLKGALSGLGMADRSFTTMPRGAVLKIHVAGSMGRDEREERIVLNSFAHLLTEVLRNKFGQRIFRNLKISIDSDGSNAGANNSA